MSAPHQGSDDDTDSESLCDPEEWERLLTLHSARIEARTGWSRSELPDIDGGKGRGRGRGRKLALPSDVASTCIHNASFGHQAKTRVEKRETTTESFSQESPLVTPETGTDFLTCGKGCGAIFGRKVVASHSCLSFLLQVNRDLTEQRDLLKANNAKKDQLIARAGERLEEAVNRFERQMQDITKLLRELADGAETGRVGSSRSENEGENEIFVYNFPLDADLLKLRMKLKCLFSAFGKVTKVFIPFHDSEGKKGNYGFVTFEDKTIVTDLVVQGSIEFEGHRYLLKNRHIKVEVKSQRRAVEEDLDEEGKVLVVKDIPLGCDLNCLRHRFKCVFGEFGVVNRVYVQMNNIPNPSQAFVHFEDSEVAARLASQGQIMIDGVSYGLRLSFKNWKPVATCFPVVVQEKDVFLNSDVPSIDSKRIDDQNVLFVGHIPKEMSENQLNDIFSDFGQIIQVFINTNDEKRLNYGFITFQDEKVVDDLVARDRLIVGNYRFHLSKRVNNGPKMCELSNETG